MNAKYKSLIILITTLLIGVIIGMVLNGWMVKQRLSNMRKAMEEQSHFMERLERHAKLEDEKWDAIQPILQVHFEKIRNIRRVSVEKWMQNEIP